MANDLAINEPLSANPQFIVDDSTHAVSSIAICTGNIGIGTKTPASMLEVAGDISVGSSTVSTPTGYGNQLRFNGIANNTDSQWIAKYNISSDVTSLRINVGDNGADSGDFLDVGYTSFKDSAWHSVMLVGSAGTVNVEGSLKVSGTFSAGALAADTLALSLPVKVAPGTANLTPLMLDRTTGKIYALN